MRHSVFVLSTFNVSFGKLVFARRLGPPDSSAANFRTAGRLKLGSMIHIAARASDGMNVRHAEHDDSRAAAAEPANNNKAQDTKDGDEEPKLPSWRRWLGYVWEALKYPSPIGPIPIRAPWVYIHNPESRNGRHYS